MDRLKQLLLATLILCAGTRATRGDALHYTVDTSFFAAVAPATAADGVTPVVQFNPVQDGLLPDAGSTMAGSFSLGSVVITPPAIGQTTNFSDQTFHLEVRVPILDTATGPGSDGWWHSDRNVFMVEGKINGQVIGGGTSQLNLTVDKIALGSFGPFIPEDKQTYHFPIDLERLGIGPLSMSLAPTSTSGAYSLVVNVQPVPEPAAIIPLGLFALWMIRSRRRVASAVMKD